MNKKTQVAIFMTALAVNTDAMEPSIFSKEYQGNKTLKGYASDFKHFEFIGDGKISDIAPGANDITQETCNTTTCSTKQELHKKQNRPISIGSAARIRGQEPADNEAVMKIKCGQKSHLISGSG